MQLTSIKLPALLLSSLFLSQSIMADEFFYTRSAVGNITDFGGAKRLNRQQVSELQQIINNNKAKNVILLIGDGMGDAEITAARNYIKGAGGYFSGLDSLQFTGSYTHYSLDKLSHLPNYVTDSAASATAWTTGVKTYNGALGVDVFQQPHRTLLELAKEHGKATGNISTAEIQDATPAALYAHVINRKCYGPDVTSDICQINALEAGGAGSITEQLLNVRADVTLGGGVKTFAELAKAGQWQGKSLTQQATERGYQIVTNLDQLNNIKHAGQTDPLLGLFAPGNMPARWIGPQAVYHGNLDDNAVTCSMNPQRKSQIPTLAEMTKKGIKLLQSNPNGFFLQVEGASIDKQAHYANPCGQFGEAADLDEAVLVALQFAKENSDTLVIVTADHAHATQIIPVNSQAYGLTQTLKTQDNSFMAISYATSETESQEHTGTQVRIAAYGPSAANVTGLIDQTDLFFIISDALSLNQVTSTQ
ncbi:alkaline phosphatase [Orbus hercynius]|uniref:Alkaline phosphatase n=1 Tax=Orbus hercynius TaxID=593135 RepID=A0A495RHR1_9GAMM|nr:alkaline phosphatase [Orbus hercynius]RKS87032.1 alkaline phosphatase [Orbus hercynius]